MAGDAFVLGTPPLPMAPLHVVLSKAREVSAAAPPKPVSPPAQASEMAPAAGGKRAAAFKLGAALSTTAAISLGAVSVTAFAARSKRRRAAAAARQTLLQRASRLVRRAESETQAPPVDSSPLHVEAASTADEAGAVAKQAAAATFAEPDNETEMLFKEAYEAEIERGRLIKVQLEAALAEQLGLEGGLGGGLRIQVDAPEAKSPLEMGGGTWRQAYEAAKERTASLELQLKKARGLGAAPAPVPPPMDVPPAPSSSSFSQESTGSSAGLPFGVDPDQMETVKKLREVSELAVEEENVLRLIASAVVSNRDFMIDEDAMMVPPGDLPPLQRAQEALSSEDFQVGETIRFDRCYIFFGQVPEGRQPGDALDSMTRRLRATGAPGALETELFLQPCKEEGKALLVMLHQSDLPDKEVPWWQWLLFAILLVVTFVAANSTTFSVMQVGQQNMNDPVAAMDTISKLGSKIVPTAAGIMATVGAQEAARRAAASKYGVELAPPLFVPAWPFASLGCFGAVSRRLGTSPSKEADFVIAASSAIAGLVVSLGLIAFGLALGPEQDNLVQLNYQLLPLFIKFVLKPLLGSTSVTDQPDPFTDPITLAFPAHPILIGGVIGLIITTLNLLPIGRLDGGVLLRSIFTSRDAGGLGLLGLALLLIGSFAPGDGGTLYLTFGLSAIIWQGGSDLPPKEAVSELNAGQQALIWALLIIGFVCSVPGWGFPNI